MGNNSQNETNPNNGEANSPKKDIGLPRWVWGGIIAAWLINLSLYFILGGNNSGVFGDQFGAINSLFSGLAFAGLIYSILQQRETLIQQKYSIDMQRNELELQRKDLQLQTQEFQEQNKTLKIQRFENTFFNMLDLHQKIVEGLEYRYDSAFQQLFSSSDNFRGREVFKRLFAEISYHLHAEGQKVYEKCTSLRVLDHYFRLTYTILQYIDNCDVNFLSETEKYTYAKIFRSTLSTYELVFLFYNGISQNNPRLKLLLEKYCMLNNLNINHLSFSLNNRDSIKSCPEQIKLLTQKLSQKGLKLNDFFFYLDTNGNADHYDLKAFCKTEEEVTSLQEALNDFKTCQKEIIEQKKAVAK